MTYSASWMLNILFLARDDMSSTQEVLSSFKDDIPGVCDTMWSAKDVMLSRNWLELGFGVVFRHIICWALMQYFVHSRGYHVLEMICQSYAGLSQWLEVKCRSLSRSLGGCMWSPVECSRKKSHVGCSIFHVECSRCFFWAHEKFCLALEKLNWARGKFCRTLDIINTELIFLHVLWYYSNT